MNTKFDRVFDELVKAHMNRAIALAIGAILLPLLLSIVIEAPVILGWGVATVLGMGCMFSMIRIFENRRLRDEYRGHLQTLDALENATDPRAISSGLSSLNCDTHAPHIRELISRRRPAIEMRLEQAEAESERRQDAEAQSRRREKLSSVISDLRRDANARITQMRKVHPLLVARDAAALQLSHVKARRKQLEADVEEILKSASWWQQLTYDYPDFREMDRQIDRLESDVGAFVSTKVYAIQEAESRFDQLEARIDQRLKAIEKAVCEAIPNSRHTPFSEDEMARNALFLGALSVPVSVWQDAMQAGAVYDRLRNVNSGYAEMSDFEIWMQCLTMPSESLTGLIALTKGALFEAHVAETTGGVLHEHFNTPDTDIAIDGTVFQIKATDSKAYIDSVDPDIPVIATSEVADATGVIDGGVSNADLESTTQLAIGGSVVDLSDTALDAVLGTLGGLGIFASLRGINHAIDRYRQGMDKTEAIEEGIAMAVTGGLKATVDLAEIGYKAATSRPSRFVGRQAMKIGSRIGRALDEAEGHENKKGNQKS